MRNDAAIQIAGGWIHAVEGGERQTRRLVLAPGDKY